MPMVPAISAPPTLPQTALVPASAVTYLIARSATLQTYVLSVLRTTLFCPQDSVEFLVPTFPTALHVDHQEFVRFATPLTVSAATAAVFYVTLRTAQTAAQKMFALLVTIC
jgi:hypothetical protein